MSRRASFFARTHPGVRRVRFPDEIVFHESIKESDGEAVIRMLRRVSVDIDINRINMSGMTAIHQAVVDNNLVLVRLLHIHGADINKPDSDTWTPLHAAAANGYHTIVSYLLSHGADRRLETEDGETAEDLVEEDDFDTLAVFKKTKEETEKLRRLSAVVVARNQEKKEPAWVRRMSLQEARKEIVTQEKEVDTRRKGSTWVGKEEIPEEEESEDEQENTTKKNVKDEKKVVIVKDEKPETLSKKHEASKEISLSTKNNSSIVKNISQPVRPGTVKLSTTTIIVSKEEDESSKLKAEKMKESCNLQSKDDVNPKTTRQRRQGRLELELGQEDHSIRSQLEVSIRAPTPTRSQFLSVSDNSIKVSSDNKKTLTSIKVSENSKTLKFSCNNEQLLSKDSKVER